LKPKVLPGRNVRRRVANWTLSTTENQSPIKFDYKGGGVSEPHSGLLKGVHPSWQTFESNKALLYKIHAIYTTSDGEVHIVPGSWRQTPTN
jgi:hypothetical protein